MFSRILVTGGSGFIGSNFVRHVLAARPQTHITNLDALTYSGNAENLRDLEGNPRYSFVHADICDTETIRPFVAKADAIVHFAAESHVDRSILDTRPFIRTNVLGTQTLLDAAVAGKVTRFVHVSTDEVYGSLPLDRRELRFTEESAIKPNSPYSASKAASDMLVRAAHHTFGLDTCITRCSNNFGPYQFPEKVIPLFVTNLLEDKKVPLYGDGLNVRDWIHVEDHCEAVLAVLERGKPGEVYNIGADNEQSNLDLTRSLLHILGKGDEFIRHVEDRLGHDRRYAIDSSKIQSELGWNATRSQWPDALIKTVDWYVKNPGWWQRIKSGAYREFHETLYANRGPAAPLASPASASA
ncbi:MAG: dTDP-glucose 4,6-dehydratase [Phycisphaeraceae bacterium]|nr:dTDP-glucose 4,6-dehydratase [Phycisphaeraceae bacterium]